MLGTILIAGMASLLICMFLGPKFIDFLRAREFGQQIREEGPAGHATKAGTLTMGGLLIMVSVVVPFLILGQFDTETLAVIGTMLASAALGFADDWMKITKKRSLGVSGKVKICVQAVIFAFPHTPRERFFLVFLPPSPRAGQHTPLLPYPLQILFRPVILKI